MAESPFVHLRAFSAYTILDGAIEPKAIGKAAKEREFPAVALCDRIGLFASMAFEDHVDDMSTMSQILDCAEDQEFGTETTVPDDENKTLH